MSPCLAGSASPTLVTLLRRDHDHLFLDQLSRLGCDDQSQPASSHDQQTTLTAGSCWCKKSRCHHTTDAGEAIARRRSAIRVGHGGKPRGIADDLLGSRPKPLVRPDADAGPRRGRGPGGVRRERRRTCRRRQSPDPTAPCRPTPATAHSSQRRPAQGCDGRGGWPPRRCA